MTDRSAAEIHIGGKIPRSVARVLCMVITKSGASLEWGGGWCRLNTPDELLLARSADPGGPLVLKLYDDQARGGEFQTLEKFLQEHGVPYCRWTEGKYDYDAEAVAFHPQSGQVSCLTDHNQHPIVLASQLAPIEAKLTSLLETMRRGEAGAIEIAAKIEDIRAGLRAEVPAAIPPLESLEIVEN
ncbi:MAG: hypothetical protein ACLQNE_22325 [Thermoguttaceae bacterium]